MKQFISEWREWSFRVAFFNLRFKIAYRLLGAKRMKVVRKKK